MSGLHKNCTPKIEGYQILEKIGTGSYSVVYKSIKKTGAKDVFAIKCVEQSKVKGSAADNILTEIKLLKQLKHKYIVQMKDFSWDNKFIYIILEYCDGGDLLCFIRRRKKLSESICKTFLQQLALAMKYLKDNNVCHMDLKPQNLLLSTKPQLTLKLGDFGFSQYLQPEDKLTSMRGSPLYMAPEILLNADYDAKVDLWSIGVIMYECLFGKAPYSSSSLVDLVEKIKMQKPIDVPQNSGLSSECRDLLVRLLKHDPKLRISFDDFFSHSFLDLEHMPSSESYKKGLEIVSQAVKYDKEKKYTDAFNLYCEALRYFVPLLIAENEVRKKSALRSKVNEYICRAEHLKQFVRPCQNSANDGNKRVSKNLSHITSGSIFRELNLLCASDSSICEVLEMGCNAEQDYADGQYRLAFDRFQNCIRVLLPFLTREPPGRRRDLLLNQVDHWMKEAENIKALLSAVDLNGANSVIEKGGELMCALNITGLVEIAIIDKNKELRILLLCTGHPSSSFCCSCAGKSLTFLQTPMIAGNVILSQFYVTEY